LQSQQYDRDPKICTSCAYSVSDSVEILPQPNLSGHSTVTLRGFIFPDVAGSRDRDAVEVALDRAFVEDVHACGRSDMAGTFLNTH
jgi:hypothetical protein